MRRVVYPKVYAVILAITHFGKRAGTARYLPAKAFTQEEWLVASHRPGKRRYYAAGMSTMKVRRQDTGEEIEIDPMGYHGHRSRRVQVGAVIKMYHHPRSRRPWVFKLKGE